MQDASRLAQPDAAGGILWRPANLDDIYSIPARTLILFDYYRFGAATRAEPWSWWRTKGKLSHQYTVDWTAAPMPPARCGFKPPDGQELERSDVGKCAKCDKLEQGEPVEPRGTVAGVRVGAAIRDGDGEGS